MTWRLGTRGSQLALWQANAVAARIVQAGGPPCEIVVLKTSGDRLQEAPLSDIGGKRLFVKEIEDALLDGRVDLAVHSAKDMSVVLPPGLRIAAALPRADPRDALILPASQDHGPLTADTPAAAIRSLRAVLGDAPRLGTSSVRRVAQLHRQLPGAEFLPIRGNVDTRLRKLDEGEFDAIVLAAAGLERLDRAGRISLCLPADVCVPAPGQGIVAVEIRDDAPAVADVLARVSDMDAMAALTAERTLVAALGGGCQLPLGGFCQRRTGDDLELLAVVTALDSDTDVRAMGFGTTADPEGLGRRVADRLIADGADVVLRDLGGWNGPTPEV
jgi:hydroxymethylbilane synthase